MDKNPQRIHRKNISEININTIRIGSTNPLFLIAGPCLIEDYGICIEIAQECKSISSKYGINYIFKASYDKANKTIKGSYRGPGIKEGLKKLEKIKSEINIPILTDVHEINQCQEASKIADVLQIPALLSKQIDLILAAAKTNKPINIKKGQFTAPWEANNVLSRLINAGYNNCMITERGYMFGYQTLISDLRALQIMSTFGQPVIYDVSHSVHGNETIISGTKFEHRDFIQPLVRSAVANGIDGLFLEIHPEPTKALSDQAGTLSLDKLDNLIKEAVEIDKVLCQ